MLFCFYRNMENSNNSYIKADGNRLINEAAIKWVEKMDECLAVCTKSIGCSPDNMHKICKLVASVADGWVCFLNCIIINTYDNLSTGTSKKTS